jgi:hypothetical protein
MQKNYPPIDMVCDKICVWRKNPVHIKLFESRPIRMTTRTTERERAVEAASDPAASESPER